MGPLWLEPHPAFPPPSGLRLRVGVGRRRDPRLVTLSWGVYGAIEALRWHDPNQEGRRDELWRHGCFEAFIRPRATDGYVELNFAPAAKWAAYAFAGYRDGMVDADVTPVVQHWVERAYLSVPRLEMQVMIVLPEAFGPADWALNMTAVLEVQDGSKSYWALAHPVDKPDFHHSGGFMASVPKP